MSSRTRCRSVRPKWSVIPENREAGVSTDIARFEAYVNQGTRLAASGSEVPARVPSDAHLSTAIALTFTAIERERLRARFLSVLAWLADSSISSKER